MCLSMTVDAQDVVICVNCSKEVKLKQRGQSKGAGLFYPKRPNPSVFTARLFQRRQIRTVIDVERLAVKHQGGD